MPNQFLSPEGDLENYFVTEYWLIDQYIGDELWSWGNGSYGQLGNSSVGNRSTPVTTSTGGTNWKQVSAGSYYTAAIKTDGTLWTWGNGNSGRLGNNGETDRSTPITTFAGGTDWKQVSVGYGHAAAIKTDGTLWTWGSGQNQLGRLSAVYFRITPVTTFAGGTNWADIATTNQDNLYTLSAGSKLSAAIKTDGTLWTWGYGINGSLGNATTSFSTISTPITTFAGGTDWKQVSVGKFKHGAGIKTDGTLWTWGYNRDGTLGNASTTNASTPVTTFAGGTNWKQVSSGGYYIAAVKTDGTLWTWGYGVVGNLGINASTNRSTPVTTFSGGTNWNQVSCGYRHTAAIKTDGTLWIWGKGDDVGQLGTGVYERQSTPVTTFAGGTNWKQVDCGYQDTVAAIKTDGTLWMWGDGQSGGLGNAALSSFLGISTPITTFAGGTNWKQVSAGGRFVTSAIKTDGTLWVWGSSIQLGIDSGTTRSTPVTTFIGGTNWDKISIGNLHTLASKTDGTLWTWGFGSYGKLGNSSLTNRSTPVTTFSGGTNWSSVEPEELYTLSAAIKHTAAIKTDGTLWTWGYGGNGELGNSDILKTYEKTPVTTFAGGTNWRQVDLGQKHTSAIKTDGTLWVWGNGKNGRLGNFSTTDRSTPVTTFAGGTDWKQVSSSYSHTSAIKTDGTLWTWGYNSVDGELGLGSPTTPRSTPVTTFAGGTNWKQVSAGFYYTAAIKTDGTLWVWGYNPDAILGINSTASRSTPTTTFAGGTNWKQVSCGYDHTTAIKTDGTLWVWGIGVNGMLGTNDSTNRSTPVTTFAGGTNWKQVSSGTFHTAAVKTDGTLWTWGAGNEGRLGLNDEINRSTPVTTFAGGTNWKQVSCSNTTTIALKDDGINKELYVFGVNSDYNLGIGDPTRIPEQVFNNSTNWKQVSAGRSHTAAIKTDGTLWTWGAGNGGRLGTSDLLNRTTPVTTFSGGTNWKQVSCGDGHTAAIKNDGTLWVWGSAANGTNILSTPTTTFAGGTDWKQVSSGSVHNAAIKTDGTLWTWGLIVSVNKLGRLSALPYRPTPVTTFAGGTNWADTATTAPEDLHTLSSGVSVASAIKTDGTLWTWGYGGFGRLGNNSSGTASTPVTTFSGGTNWKQLSTNVHTTAVKTDGTLWTWGSGGSGRLGTNDTTTRFTPVTTFAGGTNWKQVSSGTFHTAAVKTDGTLWTWGNGTVGQVGNSVSGVRSTPVTTFAGGTDWKQVSAGFYHTAAIKTDGTLWTWGNGSFGAIGNLSTTNTVTPVTTFAGGTNWKQVSGGNQHTAAVKTDGTLWIWGFATSGQLGNSSLTNRSTPVTTFAGGTNWKQVSGGNSHTAAVKTDGTLWTWGNGVSGKLGTNNTNNILTPVTTFAGGTNWKQVSAGYETIMALKDNGVNKELYVWGNNSQMQLAINSISYNPDQVFGNFTNWKQVSSGANIAAVKTDGTLWVWGSNASGELGDSSLIEEITPVTTFAGGTNWKQVDCGYLHLSAVTSGIPFDLPLS